jgi:hypothetical protein
LRSVRACDARGWRGTIQLGDNLRKFILIARHIY